MERPCILIIDDDPALRMLLQQKLEVAGYVVIEAESGHDGLEMIGTQRPDAILLDLNLPDMNGLEVMGELGNVTDETPVIIVSGHGEFDDAVRCLRYGAWDYVVKDHALGNEIARSLAANLERAAYLNKQRQRAERLQREVERRALALEEANARLEREVSVRKNAERALWDQLEFIQTIIDAVPNAIFFKNPAGQYQGCNKAFENFVELDRAAILGNHAKDVFPPTHAEQFQRNDEETLETQKAQEYEARFHNKADVLIRKAVYKNSMGDVAGIVGVFTDITQQKSIEKLLRENEANLRNLFTAAPVPIIISSLETNRLVFANPSAASYFGGDLEKAPGRQAQDYYADKAELDSFLRDLLRDGAIMEREVRLAGSDRNFWALMSGVRVNYLGEECIFASFMDIDERKQREEALAKFKFIASASQDMMTLISRDYVYETANTAFLSAHNTTLDKFIGKTVTDLWGDQPFKTNIKPYLDECFQGRQVSYRANFPVANGDPGHFEVLLYPYFNDQDEVTHAAVVSRDITGYTLSQERLRESREHFRAIFESSVDPILLFDKFMLLSDGNQAAIDKLGVPREELEGSTAEVFMENQDQYRDFHQMIIPSLRKEGAWTGEWTFHTRDGRDIVTELAISGLRTAPEGPVGGYVALMRDITDRVIAERRLLETLDEMEAIYQNTLIGVAYTKDFQIREINTRGAEIFGYERVELIDMDISMLFDDQVDAERIREEYSHLMLSEGHFDSEFQLRKRDGSLLWCSIFAKAIDRHDLGQGVIWALVDISERKYNEDVNIALYRISSAVSAAQDLDELYAHIHEILKEKLDATNFFLAELTDDRAQYELKYYSDEKKNLQGQIFSIDDPNRRSFSAEVIRLGRPIMVSEDPVRDLPHHFDSNDHEPLILTREEFRTRFDCCEKDLPAPASKVWLGVPLVVKGVTTGCMTIQSYDNPRRFSEKDLALLSSVSEQVALAIERKRNEQELRKAMHQANAANAAKSEFLANMSHEIRTPLNGVLGMLQLMESTPMTEDQQECVETALTAGRSLLSVINDILDFTKIEAGQMDVITERFDPHSLMLDIEHTFRTQAATRGLDFICDVDPSIPSRLKGGKGRIRQILFNVVGNALKFTDSGSVSVHVSLLRIFEDREVAQLLFSVEDTGIGIPDSKLNSIFEPFTQADGSYARRHEGTGLGLGIVRRLVQILGGTMALESEEGAGTIVYFTLPLQFEPQESQQTASNDICFRDMGCLQVLVVEDNRVNRLVAKRLLERLGHKVTTARNGLEALEELKYNHFDVVFMDVQMPVMDGLEATRTIRAAEPDSGINMNVPVVAMTAHAMSGDREDFIAAGMNYYLSKPAEFRDIQDLLGEMFPNATS